VDVVVGRARGSDIEIRQGLQVGEAVVASGQFLLDSEASLKAALSRLDTGGSAAQPAIRIAPAAPSGGRP
jgi:Cu(I)/Ag(I) efflux system membrane fusion protein